MKTENVTLKNGLQKWAIIKVHHEFFLNSVKTLLHVYALNRKKNGDIFFFVFKYNGFLYI